MDSEGYRNKESDGDSLPNDSDFPKPVWVRHFGLQTDSVNQRLLEYNVRAIFISIPIILLVLLVL